MKTQFIKIPNAQVLRLILERLPHLPFYGSPDSTYLIKEKNKLIGYDYNPDDSEEITIAIALDAWAWIPANFPPDTERPVLITDGKNQMVGYYSNAIWCPGTNLRGVIAWRELPVFP